MTSIPPINTNIKTSIIFLIHFFNIMACAKHMPDAHSVRLCYHYNMYFCFTHTTRPFGQVLFIIPQTFYNLHNNFQINAGNSSFYSRYDNAFTYFSFSLSEVSINRWSLMSDILTQYASGFMFEYSFIFLM